MKKYLMILVAVICFGFSVNAAESMCGSNGLKFVFSGGNFACYNSLGEIGRGTYRESLKGVKITWNGGSTQEFVLRDGAYYLGDDKYTACN